MLHTRVTRQPITAGPMTPARYLRLRREAAGLSIDDVVALVVSDAAARAGAASLLRLWEKDGVHAGFPAVLRLQRAFAFDPEVYHQLCTLPPEQHPQICRACACSHWDPCDSNEHGGACGWAEPDLCTCCTDPAHEAELRGLREVGL